MTAKSPANTAHDAARAEDERRARAELHEYIDRLERSLAAARAEREIADHCVAAVEHRLAEVTHERNAARSQRDDAIAALTSLEVHIVEHLPGYTLDDGAGANERECVELAGAELRRLRNKCD